MNSRGKALSRSDRALKQLKSCATTSVVNAIVRAVSTSPEPTSTARQPKIEREQRHDRHHEPDPEDADPHLAVDHAVAGPSRRAPHDVVGRRVDAERQRRRAVGEEVDPQDLRREQRHRHRLAGLVEADHPGEHDAEEHRSTSPMFDESRKRRNLRMLAKIAAPLAHGGDDRGEVVVGEDHVRRLLVTSVPVTPMATPMSAALSAGASFTPSPVIATICAVRLQRVDDPELVLGRDAGVDGDLAHRVPEPALVQSSSSAPVSDREPWPDAEVAGDARGGARVVAGDHDRPHSRARPASAIAAPRLGAGRVDDPDQPEVDQLALDRLVGRRRAGRPAAGGRRRPACAARGRRAGRPSPRSRRGAPRSAGALAGDPLGGAAREQHVGRALGDDGDAALALESASSVLMSLRSDVNGTSPTRSKRASRASVETLDLRLGDEEGGVGRVALDRPFAVALASRVVGEAAAADDEADLVEQRRRRRAGCPSTRSSPSGAVAAAGDVHLTGAR